ncbi:hypothetical protein K1T71_001922 [Dendrolimus kikuchii]|uniref:Uncharacterized protein n=1 Tax=Dendrolimus kikuchii TaxID=765133 RepID=A0ACC1DF29_9NEOP|nr:hypothetical protein K1T71_001922 [Dendrolimus kikuchii]
MDLLISPPSFNPDEIITTSPHTLDQNDDLMSLSDIIENYRGEPGNEVVDLPEQVLEPLLLPNDQLDANRIDLPEHTSELPISPNTASNVDRPNLPECVPSSQSIPDVHTDIDPIPSTSSCPDLPVDDYPTFLKAMADKNNSFNTNIEEHNESLMKSSTKITLVPTSMDLDESNPYIQEILSDPETLSNNQPLRKPEMAPGAQGFMFTTLVAVAVIAIVIQAQPRTADQAIQKDKVIRQVAIKAGYPVARKPKWGFFGTIFSLILEQINDTKSAYNQISDLVNNQFVPDNAVTTQPVTINGTTETPKITRAEFLNILDRNLKGLARLRNLEWREAKKDSAANLGAYKDEVFRGKKARNRR